MRVLILSQYYKPEPIPKPSDLAEELVVRGHVVTVVTGLPNYPSGSLYRGYKASLTQCETVDGIFVIRTYEYPYHGKNAIGRICNYVSFMATAPLGALLAPKCDMMYVWHPPLLVGLAAWIIARMRGIPFVYDVQDIWPDSIVLAGMLKNQKIIRMLSRVERFIYRKADHILVITEGAKRNLLAKGVPPAKVSVLPHWFDENKIVQMEKKSQAEVRSRLGWGDKFVVLFAGNIGVVQGLETAIRAAALFPEDGKYLLCLVGDGSDKQRLQELALQLGVESRIQFLDRRPAEDVLPLMAAADTLFVHLLKDPLADCVIPTKVFAYLSAAKPILMAMEGAAAELIHAADAGIVIPPGDSKALYEGITRLSGMNMNELCAMGERGRTYLTTVYPKQKVMDQYEGMLKRIWDEFMVKRGRRA